ncbi:MAG TPA: hypothetical protein VFR37_17505 [Longimicrobium sp.]|nr:hypothetical protein [Longimicrobium sp.]
MAQPSLRPLGFGEILDGAFTLYRRNFPTFALTALAGIGAVMVAFAIFGGSMLAAVASGGASAGAVGAMIGGGLLMVVIIVIAFLVMYGALASEAAQAYTGRAPTVAEGLRAGVRTAPRLFGAGFVASLGMVVVVMVVTFVFGVVTAIFANLGGLIGGLVMLLAGIGIICVYLAAIAMLFAVLPAVVVEGAGPIQALERSFQLARGALGRVLGVMAVSILITYLPLLAVMALTGGFAQMANPEAVPSTTEFVTQQILSLGVSILTTPFMVAVIVLLYFDRRVRTEALDVQMMADNLAVAGQ